MTLPANYQFPQYRSQYSLRLILVATAVTAVFAAVFATPLRAFTLWQWMWLLVGLGGAIVGFVTTDVMQRTAYQQSLKFIGRPLGEVRFSPSALTYFMGCLAIVALLMAIALLGLTGSSYSETNFMSVFAALMQFYCCGGISAQVRGRVLIGNRLFYGEQGISDGFACYPWEFVRIRADAPGHTIRLQRRLVAFNLRMTDDCTAVFEAQAAARRPQEVAAPP